MDAIQITEQYLPKELQHFKKEIIETILKVMTVKQSPARRIWEQEQLLKYSQNNYRTICQDSVDLQIVFINGAAYQVGKQLKNIKISPYMFDRYDRIDVEAVKILINFTLHDIKEKS